MLVAWQQELLWLKLIKMRLAGDPVSSFGGILIANREIDIATANEVHQLFCEVVIAPSYSDEALEVLSRKRIELY